MPMHTNNFENILEDYEAFPPLQNTNVDGKASLFLKKTPRTTSWQSIQISSVTKRPTITNNFLTFKKYLQQQKRPRPPTTSQQSTNIFVTRSPTPPTASLH
mmetsp:Transcript_19104/g.43492  ORF Transcript_19104/g.43492 Transcript_19104/m.43492 type:complete len:101 (-) Transcript_19104:1323-1625(-)